MAASNEGRRMHDRRALLVHRPGGLVLDPDRMFAGAGNPGPRSVGRETREQHPDLTRQGDPDAGCPDVIALAARGHQIALACLAVEQAENDAPHDRSPWSDDGI